MTDATTPDATSEDGETRTMVREVVGVFDSPDALEAAVQQLGSAGIDRAALSVLGTEGKDAAGAAARSPLAISDDPATPTTPFVSAASWGEARGMATAVPLVVGGFGAAWAAAAAGGALLLAIGATVTAGVVGAGLGALLFHVVARHHADAIHDQLAHGGLILWVRVADAATEARALAVLHASGAAFVHTHTIARRWGVADSPLHGVQPDPLLEHDPSPAGA